MINYTKKAKTLVEKLQASITSGQAKICENYGQKEIRKFIDRMETDKKCDLSYAAKADVRDILYRVSSIN